jgi:hypothetical protein
MVVSLLCILKEFAIMNPYWISDVWDEWVMYQNHSLEVPLKTWEEWLAERDWKQVLAERVDF